MQGFLRKHKRAILVFILLFIAGPFIFVFGMPSSRNQAQQQFEDNVVATVGAIPIYESEFRRNLDAAAYMQAQGQTRPTYEDLDKNGTAQMIIEQMIDSALIRMQEDTRRFAVEDEFAIEQIKQWPQFQDENGNFDLVSYNTWIDRERKAGRNWQELYEDVAKGVSRQVYLNMVLAPAAHISESEIERQLQENAVKMQIKYAKITPPVQISEEEIKRYYDENAINFQTPDRITARVIQIPLEAPIPELAFDIVKQAREGADFAALADEHSEIKSGNGGDMGWQQAREDDMEHRKALFQLKPGEVSDPTRAMNSVFIYKVEEERVNAESGEREVHARQIMLKAELSPEERTALDEKAQAMAVRVLEVENLDTVAQEFGFKVLDAGSFTIESEQIDNVAPIDVRTFRMTLEAETANRFLLVNGRSNHYLAEIVQRETGIIPPFEEALDRVRESAIAARKRTDEYRDEVMNYVDKAKAQKTSLAQIALLFPELEMEVKETVEPFKRTDYYLAKDQLFLQPALIFNLLEDKEPGTVDGPLQDFLGDTFLVELVECIQPTDEDRANWDEERKRLRETALRTAEQEMLEDYRQDLRERSLQRIPLSINEESINRILGRDQSASEESATAESPAEAIPMEDTVDSAAADKPLAVTAPAEEAAPEDGAVEEAALDAAPEEMAVEVVPSEEAPADPASEQ